MAVVFADGQWLVNNLVATLPQYEPVVHFTNDLFLSWSKLAGNIVFWNTNSHIPRWIHCCGMGKNIMHSVAPFTNMDK